MPRGAAGCARYVVAIAILSHVTMFGIAVATLSFFYVAMFNIAIAIASAIAIATLSQSGPASESTSLPLHPFTTCVSVVPLSRWRAISWLCH